MSGFVALCYHDGRPVEPPRLHAMLAALEHRGPDGSGTWIEGPVGMGHQMLHTTPESLDELIPLSDGRLTFTGDARLDNREELLHQPGVDQYDGARLSDSALNIAHRFSTARQADMIHVMENGRIVESGNHEQLQAKGGLYARSWQAQTDTGPADSEAEPPEANAPFVGTGQPDAIPRQQQWD